MPLSYFNRFADLLEPEAFISALKSSPLPDSVASMAVLCVHRRLGFALHIWGMSSRRYALCAYLPGTCWFRQWMFDDIPNTIPSRCFSFGVALGVYHYGKTINHSSYQIIRNWSGFDCKIKKERKKDVPWHYYLLQVYYMSYCLYVKGV